MKNEYTLAIERAAKMLLVGTANGKPILVACSQQVDSRAFIVEVWIGGQPVSRPTLTELEYHASNWQELLAAKLAEDLEQQYSL